LPSEVQLASSVLDAMPGFLVALRVAVVALRPAQQRLHLAVQRLIPGRQSPS
jgi:hypothetical protein